MSMESFNLTALCNLTQERIKELYHISENSDKAGDATWILTSAFIIFTMQSGFGLLEAGSVSSKNECNIMVKNAVDVIFGGLGYWICGFAFSFGEDETYSNAFTGFGSFFTGSSNDDNSDIILSKYFFQLSFATTATTIVSGAMAERTNLKAYMFFSFINFLSYVFPAHWIWAEGGYFKMKGVVDVAGCGPVHVVGGTAAIVASIILKPRTGVFDHSQDEKRDEYSTMASPTNVVLGTFMLWWGWLGFNCGSTFGVSGGKWKLASRAAVTTVNASVGGGIWSVFYCYVLTKEYNHKLDIGIFTNCILGGLVSITAICALCKPWEALLVGMAGGFIVSYGVLLIGKLKIDDPVSCIPVHCFCGMWGMVCVGLFGEKDEVENINLQYGVAKGGPASFLGYQIAAALAIAAWSGVSTAIQLKLTDLIFGLRMTLEEELMGADASEHGILDSNAPSMLKSGMSRGGSSRTLGKKYSTIIRNKEVATAGSEELRKRGMTNSSKETESDFGYISYHTGEGGSPLYDRAVNVNLKLCSSRSFSLRSPFVRNQLTSNSSRDERRSMSLNHKDAVLELADKIPTTQILHKVNKSPKIFEHKLYRSNSFS